jgi:GT2 family glycosyltransferase
VSGQSEATPRDTQAVGAPSTGDLTTGDLPTGDAPTGTPPRVTAVVLTYNGRELLEQMLPTLLAQRYEDFEVVVVDDGSHDGTVAHLREHWPQVRVLANPANVGVAASLNRGVLAARGEYVALLNNDIELEPGWLAALVQALEAHPRAAAATGKLLDFHHRERFEAAGDFMRWSGMSGHYGQGERVGSACEQPTAVFSPCAGAALYRRAAFTDVGLFDEDFFAYLEDVDWGFRAQLAGYTARYEPAAVAYHMGGATTGRQANRFTALLRRNSALVVLKDYPAAALLRHLPKILAFQLISLYASYRDGILAAHLRELAGSLRLLPRMLAKRRAIQRGRRVSFAQLDAMMAPEVYAGATLGERLRLLGRALAPLFRHPGASA